MDRATLNGADLKVVILVQYNRRRSPYAAAWHQRWLDAPQEGMVFTRVLVLPMVPPRRLRGRYEELAGLARRNEAGFRGSIL